MANFLNGGVYGFVSHHDEIANGRMERIILGSHDFSPSPSWSNPSSGPRTSYSEQDGYEYSSSSASTVIRNSPPASASSSSSRGTRVSRVFDTGSRQHSSPRTQASSRPSLRPTNFAGLTGPTPHHFHSQNPTVLPCEFSVYSQCNERFQYNEVQAWIEHHHEHFKYQLPSKLFCLWCKTTQFHVRDDVDKYDNFCKRMEHLKGHILDGCNLGNILPDFHVVECLDKARLIDRNAYLQAVNWHEGHPVKDIYKLGTVPPERQRQSQRALEMVYDQSAEDRGSRRNKNRTGRYYQ